MEQHKHKRQMVKVSVEVRSGAARFRVGVQAPSIREALSLVGGKYPHRGVRVLFPIEPERFFAREPPALAGIVGTEHAHQQAA
jgi:hypothetical protein